MKTASLYNEGSLGRATTSFRQVSSSVDNQAQQLMGPRILLLLGFVLFLYFWIYKTFPARLVVSKQMGWGSIAGKVWIQWIWGICCPVRFDQLGKDSCIFLLKI